VNPGRGQLGDWENREKRFKNSKEKVLKLV
jgi:hypothetical protein